MEQTQTLLGINLIFHVLNIGTFDIDADGSLDALSEKICFETTSIANLNYDPTVSNSGITCGVRDAGSYGSDSLTLEVAVGQLTVEESESAIVAINDNYNQIPFYFEHAITGELLCVRCF